MKNLRKYISLFICFAVFLSSVFVTGCFKSWASNEPTHTGLVNTQTDPLRVRSGAGASYNLLGTVAKGATVSIYGDAVDGNDGNKWYKIAYNNGFGFVSAKYIANVMEIPKYDHDADFETNLTNQKFPESYKVLLRNLHAAHPNWIFKANHLTMTLGEAVDAESVVGKSLIQDKYAKASWKSMEKYAYDWEKGSYVSYDSGGWVTASRDVVEYYMEPRNFLDENGIYMFLDQKYDEKIQNKEGLELILYGTFMEDKKDVPEDDFPEDTHKSYADVIMEAAKTSGVSPYVLAASILIEQGSDGKGGSISGTVEGFEGYYNFFNIRAYKSGNYDAVQYGLLYAKGGEDGTGTSLGRPWNTRAKSIIGGAQHYANGYVKRGQDNLYYKKFNVIVPDFYLNEYMTNIQGAYLETARVKSGYSVVSPDAALVFNIPVYKSTSETNLTVLPTSEGANNHYITNLKIDGVAVEGFDRYNNSYETSVTSQKGTVKIEAEVPAGATVTGVGEVAVQEGRNTITLTVTAASGKTATYTLYVLYKKGDAPSGSEPEPMPEPTIEGIYNMSTFVSGVEVGTNVDTFIKNFNVKNGAASVLNSQGKKTSGIIATGDKVAVYDNKGVEKAVYNIVIYGDVNADGKISIVDLARVQKHLLELSKLEGNHKNAADVNRDGKVSILDLARIQKHLLEITKIKQ